MVSSVFSRARWKSAGKHFENWSMMRYRIALNLWTSLRRGETRKSGGGAIDQKGGRHRKRLENIFTGVKMSRVGRWWRGFRLLTKHLRRSFPAARLRKLFNKGANWGLILGGRNISRTILSLLKTFIPSFIFPRKFTYLPRRWNIFLSPPPFCFII